MKFKRVLFWMNIIMAIVVVLVVLFIAFWDHILDLGFRKYAAVALVFFYVDIGIYTLLWAFAFVLYLIGYYDEDAHGKD